MISLASIGLVCAGLAAYGYLLSRYAKGLAYTLCNLLAAGVLVFVAKQAGASWTDMGLATEHLAAGLAFGIAACLVVAAATVMFVSLRGRKIEVSRKDWPEFLVRVPLGTALAEELIFRGAVFGMLLTRFSHLAALVLSSLIFGLWHLLPGPINSWAHDSLGAKAAKVWKRHAVSSLSTVIFTFAGGLLFGLLRLLTGSIVTPWLVHSAANISGLLIERSGSLTYNKSQV